jgi:PAS domain S-box-containing protein
MVQRILAHLRGSLAHRLTGATVATTLALMALVCTLAFLATRDSIRARTDATLRAEGVLVVRAIDDRLGTLAEQTAGLARRSLVGATLRDAGHAREHLMAFLHEWKRDELAIARVRIVDAQGRIVAEAGGRGQASFADTAHEAAAMKDRAPRVRASDEGLRTHVLMAYPVWSGDEPMRTAIGPRTPASPPIGAVSIEVDLSLVFAQTGASLGQAQGYELLIDGEPQQRAGQRPAQLAQSLVLPVGAGLKPALEGVAVRASVDLLRAYTPLILLGMAFLAIAIASAVGVYWLFSRIAGRLTRPLAELAQAAQQVASAGVVDPRLAVAVEGDDEIATLARAFNRMIRAVGQAHENLEAHVRTRTAELDQARVRLERILQSMHDVVYSMSPRQDRMLFVSQVVRDMIGIEAEAFVGNPSLMMRLIHPEDRFRVIDAHRAIDAQGEGRVEFRIVLPDGTERWLLDRFYVVHDAGGTRVSVDGTISDITPRVRAEQAHEAAAGLLRLKDRALEASSCGIVIADMQQPDHPLIYVNPAFERMTGFEAAEVIGFNCRFLQGDENNQPAVQTIGRAIAQGRECSVELRNYRRSGEPFINQLTLAPVRDTASGKVTHYVGVQSDVTAKRGAELRLFDSFVKLDTLFTLSPDGFVTFGEDDLIAFVNPAFERMVGRFSGDLIGMTLEGLDALLRSLSNPAFGYRGLCDDAGAAGDGELSEDASMRRLLFMERPQARVLQWRGREGGSSTSNKVLYFRDVTREAEVDRMKSEFLSTAAHELRTPMASIMGFSELLLRRRYDEHRSRDMLETINRQAGRLTRLLNELLDLARIEARAGKDFDISRQPLAPLVQATLAELMVPGDARVVEVDLPGTLPLVDVDAAKLQQALTNVLSNAYKYSPGGGAIRLSAVHREHKGQDFIGLRVADEGIGMTPEQLARAFERFWRADGSGNIPGTGLGLCLVREIVEIHGGQVQIDSRYGEGTTFTLWLPQARPGEPVRRAVHPASTSAAGGAAPAASAAAAPSSIDDWSEPATASRVDSQESGAEA